MAFTWKVRTVKDKEMEEALNELELERYDIHSIHDISPGYDAKFVVTGRKKLILPVTALEVAPITTRRSQPIIGPGKRPTNKSSTCMTKSNPASTPSWSDFMYPTATSLGQLLCRVKASRTQAGIRYRVGTVVAG